MNTGTVLSERASAAFTTAVLLMAIVVERFPKAGPTDLRTEQRRQGRNLQPWFWGVAVPYQHQSYRPLLPRCERLGVTPRCRRTRPVRVGLATVAFLCHVGRSRRSGGVLVDHLSTEQQGQGTARRHRRRHVHQHRLSRRRDGDPDSPESITELPVRRAVRLPAW